MPAPIYLVICGSLEPYAMERALPDMTWAGTVQDIAGMQFENLNRVIEVGTGRDVTEQMVREAADLNIQRRTSSYKFAELVELVLGTRTARPFFIGAGE